MRDDNGDEVEQLSREELKEIGALQPENRNKFKEWKPVYTKILVMVQKGMPLREIARSPEVDMSVGYLSKFVNSPTFRLRMLNYTNKVDAVIMDKAINDITKTPEVELARNKLATATEDAAAILIQLMNPKSKLSKEHSINERRLMATIAQDVLDRGGLKNTVIAEDPSKSREYTPEEIESAVSNARELEHIATRLGSGTSYVLSKDQRSTGDGSVSQPPTDAVEQEGTSVQTKGYEEGVLYEQEG